MRAEGADAVAVGSPRSRPYLVFVALILGLLGGTLAQASGDGMREPLIKIAAWVGGIWLDALTMTVVPLIVALLITGIAKGADAARAGGIAARSMIWFAVIYVTSAITGAVVMLALLRSFPLPQYAGEALRTGLSAIDPATASAPIPGTADFFRNIVPSNVIAAAANGEVLPLVVFAVLFAMALTRLAATRRKPVADLFEGIAGALLVIIRWVLWFAPLGVLALGFALGASAGGAAFAGVLHYILLVSVVGLLITLGGYPLAVLAGRRRLGEFAKAMIAPQSVAISTRSSLACLPAMLGSASSLRVREEVLDVTLPMAVALLRATGPAMNVAVAFYVASWLGHEPGWVAAVAAVAIATIMSFGAVSLPGEVSFISSIAPIALALGVPIAPLAVLVAVEMIPDTVRTLGNVTLDVAVATAVDRNTLDEATASKT